MYPLPCCKGAKTAVYLLLGFDVKISVIFVIETFLDTGHALPPSPFPYAGRRAPPT